MNGKFTRQTLITRLAALALISLCLFQTHIRAQQPEDSASGQNDDGIVLFSSSPIGIARGQALRVSLGFAQAREASFEIRALARLFDAEGNLIGESPALAIPPTGFLTIDFNGDALPQSGAVGQHEISGAIVRINVVPAGSSGSGQGQGKIILPDMLTIKHMSLELFDNLTGETQVHINPHTISGQTYEDVPPTDTFHVGLVAGQSLRVNVAGPSEGDLPFLTQAILLDAQGNQIAQSEEVAIAAGAFASFVFNRNDLALAGEAGTRRLQVAAGYRLRVEGCDSPCSGRESVSASLELVDESTGRTTIMISQKPKEIVVVGSTPPRQ